LFYANSAVDEAARLIFEEALLVDGLDGEIALLRTKIRELQEATGPDITWLLKCIDLLVKAVAARYRLSPASKRDLSDNIARVLQGASDIMAQEYADV
jgi:hypothetical protein